MLPMRIEHGLMKGDQHLMDDVVLHGTLLGSATVMPGVTLVVHGRVEGDVILERHSTVFLHGAVGGSVHNHGGSLYIYGTIEGSLHKEGGTTTMASWGEVRGETWSVVHTAGGIEATATRGLPSAAEPERTAMCPICQTPNVPMARFCSRCGFELSGRPIGRFVP